MFDVPCSRVGHIYRKYVPYKVPSGTSLARVSNWVSEWVGLDVWVVPAAPCPGQFRTQSDRHNLAGVLTVTQP